MRPTSNLLWFVLLWGKWSILDDDHPLRLGIKGRVCFPYANILHFPVLPWGFQSSRVSAMASVSPMNSGRFNPIGIPKQFSIRQYSYVLLTSGWKSVAVPTHPWISNSAVLLRSGNGVSSSSAARMKFICSIPSTTCTERRSHTNDWKREKINGRQLFLFEGPTMKFLSKFQWQFWNLLRAFSDGKMNCVREIQYLLNYFWEFKTLSESPRSRLKSLSAIRTDCSPE